jgi:hypothetical protein
LASIINSTSFPHRLPHSTYPRRIDTGLLGIDRNDHFESLLTLGDDLLGDLHQLFCVVLLKAEGYVRLHWVVRAAKQPPDRLSVMLAFDIPQRYVDGTDGRAPHTGLSARIKSRV